MNSSKCLEYGVINGLKPIKMVREEIDEEEEEEQPLSPASRMFHEPDTNVYILVILGFKTCIDPDIVKENLVDALLKHPRSSCLQVEVEEKSRKMMKWVKTKVDIENHVIVPQLNPNMDSGDKFVEDYISNLSKTTIEMSKPLWDFHLLNIKTSNAEAISILRVHHSLGDGASLMSLLLASTRTVSNPQALPTIPIKKSVPKKFGGFWHYIFGFWSVLRLLWNTIVDVFTFIMTALFLKDTNTALGGLNGRTGSSSRRIVYKIFSFDDIKLLKTAMRTTTNDIILGVIQAGLSRYLNKKYGESEKDQTGMDGNNNLPKNIRLRATVLVNMRPSPEIHALGDDGKDKGSNTDQLGNRIGYVLFPFIVALRDDPLDYVRDAKATMDRKKHSLAAIGTFIISKLLFRFFGLKGARILSKRVPSHTTMFFSNMPGPREEIAFCGYPISYLAPSCYGLPNGLMIHVQSYANKLTMVLSVDESIICDPHQLCDDIEKSLDLIKNAVIERAQIAHTKYE